MNSINPLVLQEARRQIGLLFHSLRKDKGIGTKKMAELSGLTEAQIIDIEKNRRNYTIDSFLKYVKALDMYFFLSSNVLIVEKDTSINSAKLL